VNRVIFDVTQAVGKEKPFWMWPTVDTEELGNIDPLRDERVVEVLRKQGISNCGNVRGLGKSMAAFRLFEKLRYLNESSD